MARSSARYAVRHKLRAPDITDAMVKDLFELIDADHNGLIEVQQQAWQKQAAAPALALGIALTVALTTTLTTALTTAFAAALDS